jgi:NAD(P)-dependent dehydrogenase (short-subunit alcohol dehydrogenase family)
MATMAQRSGDDAPHAVVGKVALITGGSRGIGLATARALSAAGARVAITGRDRTALIEASDGGSLLAIRADLQDPEEASRAVAETVSSLGGLDIVVNNAAFATLGPVADMTVEDWQRTLRTNLDGVFYTCHAALPQLRARGGGWIINISSLASANPFAGGAAYCASKAGLNAFSEALMQEVRYDNIRVSYVMPGSVATGFAGSEKAEWKLSAEDVAQVVMDLLAFPARSLPSRVELRPSRPKPKK